MFSISFRNSPSLNINNHFQTHEETVKPDKCKHKHNIKKMLVYNTVPVCLCLCLFHQCYAYFTSGKQYEIISTSTTRFNGLMWLLSCNVNQNF